MNSNNSIAFCIACLAAVIAPALQSSAQPSSFPFREETLTYTIRHNLFPSDIGTMTFKAYDTKSAYHAEAELETSEAYRSIYYLKTTHTSSFAMDDILTPLSATSSTREKKYRKDTRYNWSGPHYVAASVTKRDGMTRDTTLASPSIIRDLLGTIWWLRVQDYDNGRPTLSGTSLLLDRTPLPVAISSWKKKDIRIGGKKVPAIEVVLSQKDHEVMRLVMADDQFRTPLSFTLSMSFGKIKGTLLTAPTNEFVGFPWRSHKSVGFLGHFS